MRILHFKTQYGPLAPKKYFSENPLVNLVAFIHVYLHAKKAESDVNPLMR